MIAPICLLSGGRKQRFFIHFRDAGKERWDGVAGELFLQIVAPSLMPYEASKEPRGERFLA